MSNSNRAQLAKDLADALAAHIREHATEYFPQLARQPLHVRIGKLERRQFADLCRIEIQSPIESKHILVKIALPASDFANASTEESVITRFTATPDPVGCEYRAMTSLERHVSDIGDSRLFAVRAIDSILDDRALLLEVADAKSLDRLLMSATRLGGRSSMPALLPSVQRAGVGLRALHRMPAGDRRRSRGATRAELLEWIAAAEALVADDRFARDFFRVACRRIITLAERALPKQLPIGPLHDDFAPRNVLVNTLGQIGIIDMLDEWTGCVWEDVGQFLAALAVNKAQALTGGRTYSQGQMATLRDAFISGYYGDKDVPSREIAVYESAAILTKWAAEQSRLAQRARWRGSLKRVRLAVVRRWYARCVEQCLRRAELPVADKKNVQRSVPQLVAGGMS